MSFDTCVLAFHPNYLDLDNLHYYLSHVPRLLHDIQLWCQPQVFLVSAVGFLSLKMMWTVRHETARHRELFACAGQASVVVAGQRQNAVTDVRKNLCR